MTADLSTTSSCPDRETRLAFARAVAPRSRAHVLDENNRKVQETTVGRAVEDDLAFYVEVPPEILAFDLDAPSATSDAESIYLRLLMNGYAPVLLASGQQGRRHVFCHVPEQARLAVLALLGIQPRDQRLRSDIRPPLARHRYPGLRSRLVLPETEDDALTRLTGRSRVRALGDRANAVLQKSQVEDVSASTYSVALGAANAGWSLAELRLALTSPAIPLSAEYARRAARIGERQTTQWLERRVWTSAVKQCAENPPIRTTSAPVGVLRAAAWALGRPWPGRSGPTDFAVFIALLWGWRRSGLRRFHLSEREIMLYAGISSRSTVARALACLQKLRLDGLPLVQRTCEQHAAARMQLAAEFQVNIPDAWENTVPEAVLEQIWEVLAHDAFRNTVGLGKTAAVLLIHALSGGLLTSVELAQRTGVTVATVERQMATLKDFGMVVKVGAEWSAAYVDLDRAAKEIHADGRGDQQRVQISRERSARDILVNRPRRN